MYAFFIALSSRLAKISRKSALEGFSYAREISRSAFVSEACFNKTLASQVDRFPGTYPPNFNESTHAISGVLHFRGFEDSDGNAFQLQRPPQPFFAATGGIRKLNWRQRLGLPNSANFIFARFIARFLRIRFFLIRCCLLISLPRT